MKRVLLLLICLFMLVAGCAYNTEKTEQSENENIIIEERANPVEPEITFKTGSYDHKFWETDKIEDYPGYCVIPDEDAAVKIATAIYKELPIFAFEAQSVFFDEEDEVWIVSFYPPIPDSGPVAIGSCHSIALRKKDGKVLSIFDY